VERVVLELSNVSILSVVRYLFRVESAMFIFFFLASCNQFVLATEIFLRQFRIYCAIFEGHADLSQGSNVPREKCCP
jgi:hypothetical protein